NDDLNLRESDLKEINLDEPTAYASSPEHSVSDTYELEEVEEIDLEADERLSKPQPSSIGELAAAESTAEADETSKYRLDLDELEDSSLDEDFEITEDEIDEHQFLTLEEEDAAAYSENVGGALAEIDENQLQRAVKEHLTASIDYS